MNRLIKILIMLGMIIIMGCDSSKGVIGVPGPDVPDDSMSVKFDVDKSSYADMDVNSFVSLTIRPDEAGSTPQTVAAGQRYILERNKNYVLSGFYINTSNVAVPFPNSVFLLNPFTTIHKSADVTRSFTSLNISYY